MRDRNHLHFSVLVPWVKEERRKGKKKEMKRSAFKEGKNGEVEVVGCSFSFLNDNDQGDEKERK